MIVFPNIKQNWCCIQNYHMDLGSQKKKNGLEFCFLVPEISNKSYSCIFFNTLYEYWYNIVQISSKYWLKHCPNIFQILYTKCQHISENIEKVSHYEDEGVQPLIEWPNVMGVPKKNNLKSRWNWTSKFHGFSYLLKKVVPFGNVLDMLEFYIFRQRACFHTWLCMCVRVFTTNF